jgi:nitric oxide reductase subunit C
MRIAQRKALMAGLFAAFVGQTWMVYTDPAGAASTPLSPLALRGRQIWHAHNCQLCHQIYGFGGFIGPDLTNAASRLTRARLDEVLTVGNRQMPAFHFDRDRIDAIEAYLRALDGTGIGQARNRIPPSAAAIERAIDAHAASVPLPDDAARGRAMFASRCVSCHTLFRATPLGPFLAADLTSVRQRASDAEIRRTMTEGRVLKGMPPSGLRDDQQGEMLAFFTWLGEHRDALRARLGDAGQTVTLPWFEYK